MAIYDDLFKAPVEKKEESNRSANTSDWAAEQKAAREEAYALADKTALSISEDGKRFREYLDIQSRFENYSATNALLILAQLPKATSLKEKSSWIEAGHSINENATPISIIKPGKSYQRDDASYGNYYNVHSVYDVSQTDAPVPVKPSVNYDERLLITALISKRPVPIELSDDIANGAVYDNEKKKIVLFYTGDIAVAELTAYIKSKLPRYMIPNVTKQLEELPYTPNGKIDRNGLKNLYAGK